MILEKLLDKHARNFVQNKDAAHFRPALEGILYHKNGNVYITNSHIALRINEAHVEPSKLVHHKSGKLLDENYPEIDRVFPENNNLVFTVKLETVKPYLGTLKVIHDYLDEVVALSIKDGGVHINANNDRGESATIHIGQVSKDFNETVNLNDRYLRDVFYCLGDTGFEDVTIGLNGGMRPIHFVAGNCEAIILPVRRY